jgi:hypothetical protein
MKSPMLIDKYKLRLQRHANLFIPRSRPTHSPMPAVHNRFYFSARRVIPTLTRLLSTAPVLGELALEPVPRLPSLLPEQNCSIVSVEVESLPRACTDLDPMQVLTLPM